MIHTYLLNTCLAVEEIRWVRELKDLKLSELNKKITLDCELSKEGLKVEWTKDGKKLRRDEHYDIIAEGKVHSLVIEKAGPGDVGKYSAVYEKLTTAAAISIAGALNS